MAVEVITGGLHDEIRFDNPNARITSESLAIVNADGTQTTVYEYDVSNGLAVNEDLVTLVSLLPEKQSISPVRWFRLAGAAIQGTLGSIIDRKDK